MQEEFVAIVDTETGSNSEAFLKAKVEITRAQIAEGRHVSNEEVKAEFSKRRDAVRQKFGIR